MAMPNTRFRCYDYKMRFLGFIEPSAVNKPELRPKDCCTLVRMSGTTVTAENVMPGHEDRVGQPGVDWLEFTLLDETKPVRFSTDLGKATEAIRSRRERTKAA